MDTDTSRGGAAMTEHTFQSLDADPSAPPEGSAQPAKPRTRPAWALPVGALVAGLLVGGGIGAAIAASDPTQSAEYRTQSAELDEIRQELEDVKGDLTSARRDVNTAEGDAREAAEVATQTIKDAEDGLLARAGELDLRELAVAGREQAVTAVENRIKETSIGTGIWTVGVDVEPGTYRVSEPLTGYCYWSITASGTNGDDIIENDGPTGGFPTVTLSAGQDFENSGCGTFVKQ